VQNTLKASVTFDGVGLHSGKPVRMILKPAAAGHGICFRRTDIALGNTLVPALWDRVERTPLCTRLVNASGVAVSTVEHIMAALAGCGIHNAMIDIDGPEVPIMDGSSAYFVRGIMQTGIQRLAAPVTAYQILKPVSVSNEGATATLLPSNRLTIEFHIDFAEAAIGRQSKTLDLRNGAFARELCDSRTFCRQADVDAIGDHRFHPGQVGECQAQPFADQLRVFDDEDFHGACPWRAAMGVFHARRQSAAVGNGGM